MSCWAAGPSVPPERVTAVVLAAQRDGRLDPLADRAGVSHKCLVPIGGRPLIAHVLGALDAVAGLGEIRVCIEPDAFAEIETLWRGRAPLTLIPAAANLAESVYASAEGVDGLIVITTADNVLLSAGAVETLLDAHRRGADVTIAMTTRARILAAHPDGQRRFYRLADDHYSNCNLYGLAGPRALRAAEAFRSGGQFAKNPRRLIATLGLGNILAIRLGLVSLRSGMRRLSARLGLRVEAVVLDDGAHAIDVDNARSCAIVRLLLAQRQLEVETARAA